MLGHERLAKYPGTARYTSMEYHDETFERFPRNFKYFQDIFLEEPGKLIDSIEVYKRSKDIVDLEEDTKVYSSDENNDDRTALDAIMELRNLNYEIDHNDFDDITKKILKNKDYLRSQGTLTEIIRNLAVIMGYPKIVKRLDEIKYRLEEDLNKD